MVEAEFGLAHLTGSRDGPPVKVGVAVTDLTTGLYAVNSILAAVVARTTSGEGQHLDVCLSDCQVATLANMGSSVLISGEKDSGRWGTAHRMLPSFALVAPVLTIFFWWLTLSRNV
jgi:crotonobetainyl-CoA:carnitine CoA-transferase CaiB-like acyl-CoA transferase